MYESHFGLTATPFGLNPDPAFYFESKGHGHALAYLRFGVYQGEGFVVVTGEIGAGKTTLVRTLLSELDSQRIVAAQIVSTQLEAGELLRSVALAFGLPLKNLSKAELIASIEAFLTALVTQGKRALLVVDEAQNLDLQAIEELRMLSNFQLGQHALLQSFLVGQPELRNLLTSKPMEQFRQRVIASCHLGRMDASETRAYVEHRLRQAGWAGRPAIDPEGFERIHVHTSGIPRRINLLCNRLLLATYLGSLESVDAPLVDSVASDSSAEFGGLPAMNAKAAAPNSAPRPPVVSARRDHDEPRPLPMSAGEGPLVCVVGDRADHARMILLLALLDQEIADFQSLLVRVGDPAGFELDDDYIRRLGADIATVDIPVAETTACAGLAHMIRQIEELVVLHQPGGVMACGWDDAVFAAAIVASRKGCRFRHLDAARAPLNGRFSTVNEALIRVASAGEIAEAAPEQFGTRPSHILLAEAAALASGHAPPPATVLSTLSDGRRALVQQQGYGLVVRSSRAGLPQTGSLKALASLMRDASERVPLLWAVDPGTVAQLDALGMRRMLKGERLVLLDRQGFVETVSLIGGARCVLTDDSDTIAEAEALGIPALALPELSDRPLAMQERAAFMQKISAESLPHPIDAAHRTQSPHHQAEVAGIVSDVVRWFNDSDGADQEPARAAE